ncbi:hypothetical protein KUD11_08665 [Roseovarius sp. LXJ103]|uniref:hypothetical protein n=1 Tax=Roseovarius carneus TaxID=2853164 RepID=UPI000D6139EA|nr:hypothetical protein [Roseovarius carneus]MBZ8118720.1 hypothetical protein [Roseovarius carneus]PWE35604.1 hypothetical protein DD563_06295 [Pelagicola sp. LXJ1103]
MTALQNYDRLEASGLWRASPDDQRTEVVISVGEATLVITDMRDRPLAHWSIPAVSRANPGHRPAIFHPDGDSGETLEIAADEAAMIDAIEQLRTAVERRRPHPGRLRLAMLAGSVATVGALVVFWLPGAVREHALRVVPEVKRAAIGEALMQQISVVTGPPCRAPGGRAALALLAERLPGINPGQLTILRGGVASTASLPGGAILINHTLVEDYDEPDVVAGFALAQSLRARSTDPLDDLLRTGGIMASLRLLTTGNPGDAALQRYGEAMLTRPTAPVPDEVLLQAFEEAGLRSTPYAYAHDISGESTLALIEADPFAAEVPEPLLRDADWLRLQGICGG